MPRRAHRNPPSGWVFVKRTRDGEDIDEIWRYRGSEITIRFGEAGEADLHAAPEAIEAVMEDAGGSITAWVRSPNGARFVVEDIYEDNMTYSSRDEAFAEVGKIADIIADSPGIRMPQWRTEDLPKYLRWFQTQSPNQADYIRLFESNDKNGNFTGLFLEPLSASEDLFREVFADELGSSTRSAAAVAALAKINRARERAGEKPLDPDQAGWSDDDLLAEAKRVRGNPDTRSVAQLLKDAEHEIAVGKRSTDRPGAHAAYAMNLIEAAVDKATTQAEIERAWRVLKKLAKSNTMIDAQAARYHVVETGIRNALKRMTEPLSKSEAQALARKTVQQYGHLSAAQWRERIPGGKARGKGPRDFPQTALARGIVVELEHTSDPLVAMEITMDHLVESLLYYEDLARVHPEDNARRNPHASYVVPERMYLYEYSGEKQYFYARERLKNGGWKGTLVRDHGRYESRGPLKHIVDKRTIEYFHEIPLSDVPEPSRRRFEKAGLTFPDAAAASNPTQRMAARLARGHSR